MTHDVPIEIVPSYPAPSWEALTDVLRQLSGVAPEFQVDVVAEAFAGTCSWPETEVDPIKAIEQLSAWSEQFTFELDLMVPEPTRYFASCVSVGISKVVIHMEAVADLSAVLHEAEANNLSVTLALTADTPLDPLFSYLREGEVEAVQLMGIAQVGQQGQPFDERVLPRIRQLRQEFPDIVIAVDGAVNETTLPQLYAAGANRFAPGSAVVQSADPAAAYKQLVDLVT